MSNSSARFFDALGRRGHEPLLQEATGTIRFDLGHERGVDRWFLEIERGDVRVSADGAGADCVIHGRRALFDRIVDGESHIYTAWVRNELMVEGDVRLARLIQRLMPGPPDARHPRDFARQRRRAA